MPGTVHEDRVAVGEIGQQAERVLHRSRGVPVAMATLTAQGVQLIDAAIASHFVQADRAIAGLDPTERSELARLLRKLRLQLTTSEAP